MDKEIYIQPSKSIIVWETVEPQHGLYHQPLNLFLVIYVCSKVRRTHLHPYVYHLILHIRNNLQDFEH